MLCKSESEDVFDEYIEEDILDDSDKYNDDRAKPLKARKEQFKKIDDFMNGKKHLFFNC